MEKRFELNDQNTEKQPNYKDRILRIINEREEAIRAISPEGALDAETHGQTMIETRDEWREFEKVRADVCDAFGIIQDERHQFIYDREMASADTAKATESKRAVRAFCVVVDALKKESFYADGRIDHYSLFDELVKRINKGRLDYASMGVFYGEQSGPSRYLFFKGFIDKDEFGSLTPEARRVLCTPIYDSEGNEIQTPINWFITGHNLEQQKPVD